MTKHILILPPGHFNTELSPLGGIFQLDLAKALIKKGYKVGIISVARYPISTLFKTYNYPMFELLDGIPVFRSYHRLPIPASLDPWMYTGVLLSANANRVLKKYIDKYGKPDLIHAHNIRYSGIIASILSAKMNIPFILTEHSSEFATGEIPHRSRKICRSVMSSASAISAVSNSLKEHIQQTVGSEYCEHISVIPNLLPDAFYEKEKAPAALDKSKYIYTFTNVAEALPIKNQKLLISAFAESFKNKNAVLQIIGDGELLAELKNLAIKLSVNDQVKFFGRVPRNQIKDLLCGSDCFVLTSNHETFGVVLIESLSQGLPVISTACGGPNDIVTKYNGILVPPKNKISLSKAMLKMFMSISNYDRTFIAADCVNKFGVDKIVAKYNDLYSSVISK